MGRRLIVVAGLFVAALVAAAWVNQQQAKVALPAGQASPARPGHIFFADTEGWYRITPDETAVVSPYQLTLDALPASLPVQIGDWRGVDLPNGPEIDAWFDRPVVAIQRAYTDPAGHLVWLAVFGHHGPQSFHLFEHTPASCYPLSGWTMTAEDRDTIPVGRGVIHARRGFARNGDQRLVVLYWYLWDNPQRNPDDGVLSIRISTPIVESDAATLRLLKARFVPLLFTDVLPWHRFGS
jgi:hypothetical protein